ncbi:hypothetical protein LJC74_04375 [Eubacteriales bacterium OttesenSCG-928-A19]|nr:hypothetical protein [Eubacteriales bacterium OttesenSCG-928-A19]
MAQNSRKWFALLCAILLYYIIHEGAHVIAALLMGTFQGIRIMGFGLGVQIMADTAAMSNVQIFIFCIAGAIATLLTGYVLVLKRQTILNSSNKLFRAIAYYTTLVFLMLDPIYLSILHNFVGGGDMNGITQMGVSALPVSIVFFIIGGLNLFLIIKYVYKDYKRAFTEM